jgi:hypothetical protein
MKLRRMGHPVQVPAATMGNPGQPAIALAFRSSFSELETRGELGVARVVGLGADRAEG